MTRSLATLLAILPLLGRAETPAPLVYLPFDRDVLVGVGRTDDTTILPETDETQPAGVRGQCLHIATDLRLPARGNFLRREGTLAFWMRAA